MNLDSQNKLRVFQLYDRVPGELVWFNFLSFGNTRKGWYTKTCQNFMHQVERETGLTLNISVFNRLFQDSKVSNLLEYTKDWIIEQVGEKHAKELFVALVAFMTQSTEDLARIEKLLDYCIN